MACKSLISPVAQIMIHNCSTSADGDYRDMDSASQMLQSINQGIRNAYKAKTGLSDDQLKELMDKTTWMSAQDAVKYGFVDGVMTFDKGEGPADAVTNMAQGNPLEFSNSSRYLTPDDISKLQSVIKQNDVKNVNTGNVKPVEQPINSADPQACILNKDQTKQIEGGKTMNLTDLLKEHPEIQNEINALKDTAKNEGITEERNRLQSIDKIAATLPADMVSNAKYSEPMNAAELALKAVEDAQAKGKNYITAAISDSQKSGVDQVVPTPSDNDEDPDDALINVAVKAANSKRKEIK
jgi:hypothetical protein